MELPEVCTIARQASELLPGKVIEEVFGPTQPHKFAFFSSDIEDYVKELTGKKIQSISGAGMFVDLHFSGNVNLALGDGIIIKYGDVSSKLPTKYQLLLTFTDETYLVFTVAMYGGMYLYKDRYDNIYHEMSREKVSPISKEFDKAYFDDLINNEKKNITVKALLATEQRIPGLGNGVLQDILFNARIHPKRKIDTLSDKEKENLYHSVKDTLSKMIAEGGRDTETDMYGNKGGYKTILSAKTYKDGCPVCGGEIVKEPFMGGSVYYCPKCQKL